MVDSYHQLPALQRGLLLAFLLPFFLTIPVLAAHEPIYPVSEPELYHDETKVHTTHFDKGVWPLISNDPKMEFNSRKLPGSGSSRTYLSQALRDSKTSKKPQYKTEPPKRVYVPSSKPKIPTKTVEPIEKDRQQPRSGVKSVDPRAQQETTATSEENRKKDAPVVRPLPEIKIFSQPTIELITVPVPDLRGRTLREAEGLARKAGLSIQQAGEEYSAHINTGRVIRQDPLPNYRVPRGSRIQVWLSARQAAQKVPNLIGLRPVETNRKYPDIRFKVEVVDEQYSKAQLGTIIQQNPQPGANLPRNGLIEVWLSAGVPPQKVPNLIGLRPVETNRKYPKIKFKVEVVDEQYSKANLGTIIRQEPAPESELPQDGRIEVWLSLGPKAFPEELMADLRGLTLQQARESVRELGLRIYEAGKVHSKQYLADLISEQNPGVNSRLPRDGRVEVWLSLGPEPLQEVIVPDLLDMTLSEANQVVLKEGLNIQEKGQEVSLQYKPGRISRQDPAPGAELIRGNQVRVWLSRGISPWIWFATVAAFGGIVVIVAKSFISRRKTNKDNSWKKESLDSDAPSMKVRAFCDFGRQTITTDSDQVDGPDISLRVSVDRGKQRID